MNATAASGGKPRLREDGTVDLLLTPREIFNDLRSVVHGQDAALRSFAVAAWRHRHGLRQGAVLITGPTGSGKTLLAKAYADRCDIPLVHVTSTALVAEGIRGQTMGDVLMSLFYAAHNHYANACKGILVIDEVDKIQSNHYAASIEHSLLSILDGTPWRSFDGEKKPPFPGGCFRTDRLFVVLLGSYTGVRQQRSQRVGFNTDALTSPSDIPLEELVALDDLRGRISTHVQIKAHTRRSLLMILNSEDGPMRVLRDSLPQWYLFLTNDAKERLVGEVLENGLGARHLWTLVASLSESLVFSPPTHPGVFGSIVVQSRSA